MTPSIKKSLYAPDFGAPLHELVHHYGAAGTRPQSESRKSPAPSLTRQDEEIALEVNIYSSDGRFIWKNSFVMSMSIEFHAELQNNIRMRKAIRFVLLQCAVENTQ
uniref:Uncharacterized protein n=1 Tax=Romanomermis culicivorax TaxID=13658 RepID=A0A915HUY9_ROMCU